MARASFLTLDRMHMEGPDGSVITRVAVRHPGAVAVVPLIDDDVVLIEQYRAPIGMALLEIPAGKLDVPGEPPLEAAQRELVEEVGFRADRIEHLGRLHTTPGFSDEVIWIFLGRGLKHVGSSPSGAEEHSARIIRMPLSEAVAGISVGKITDAKTIAGLHLVSRLA